MPFGWAEMLVIGIVALIVVGPKDLPVMFRTFGRFVGKARGMAREFSRAMNEAADETGMRDVAKGLQSATNPVQTAVQGVKDTTGKIMDFDPDSETGKLAAKRAEDSAKIKAASARAAADRKLKEAEAAREAAERAEEELAALDGKKDG